MLYGSKSKCAYNVASSDRWPVGSVAKRFQRRSNSPSSTHSPKHRRMATPISPVTVDAPGSAAGAPRSAADGITGGKALVAPAYAISVCECWSSAEPRATASGWLGLGPIQLAAGTKSTCIRARMSADAKCSRCCLQNLVATSDSAGVEGAVAMRDRGLEDARYLEDGAPVLVQEAHGGWVILAVACQ